ATVVSGFTNSADFPVIHPILPDAAVVVPQGFLMKVVHGPNKDRVAFSSFLYESGGAVSSDASGAIYFSGLYTFAGKLDRTGRLEYVFHGIGGRGLAVSGTQRIAVAGPAPLAGLPVFRAIRPYSDLHMAGSTAAGWGDGFLTILSEGPNPGATREQDDAAVTYAG